jgi:hypothetical protein
LEKNLHIKISHLIYPFGNYNQQVMQTAKNLGYEFATTVEPEKDDNQIDLEKQAFNLPRHRVFGQQEGNLSGFFKN